jgi:hypothetical protein
MRRFIPMLALSLLVVGCESRADKVKRVCSAWINSADGSVSEKELKAEIYKLSGETEEDFVARNFCFKNIGL